MQTAHIRPLTALRFFAAMWVVLYHYWPNLGVVGTPALVAKGYLGVELFFTLSGFILCHVYLSSVADGRFRYGSFLWTRLARVYPLHLATLIGVGAMALAAIAIGRSVDTSVLSWSSLPANLFLVHAWGLAPAAGWNHPSWSISAEWFAYLCFPGFAWAALKLRDRPWTALAGALGLLAALYAVFPVLAGFPLTHATIAWGALRIVPCFGYGCALYLVWRAHQVRQHAQAVAGACFSGACVVLSAHFAAPDTISVAMFGALILCLAGLKNKATPETKDGIFVYLGEISYSIYMICIPWQLLSTNVLSAMTGIDKYHLPVSIWMAFVVTLIPLAALSHHLIEKPARALMKGWSQAPRGTLASVAQ